MDLNNKTPEEIFDIIRECCSMLGWDIAFDAENSMIAGALLGKPTYVSDILDLIDPDRERHDVYTCSKNEEDAGLH